MCVKESMGTLWIVFDVIYLVDLSELHYKIIIYNLVINYWLYICKQIITNLVVKTKFLVIFKFYFIIIIRFPRPLVCALLLAPRTYHPVAKEWRGMRWIMLLCLRICSGIDMRRVVVLHVCFMLKACVCVPKWVEVQGTRHNIRLTLNARTASLNPTSPHIYSYIYKFTLNIQDDDYDAYL